MISIVIPTLNSERELAALLPVLVPAAVDGLVREVICADAGSTDATLAICEDSGAEVVADLAAAGRGAKGELLLVLPPSLRLRPGWEESVRRHLDRGSGAALVLADAPGLLERLAGPKLAGVLVAREAFAKLAPRDLADLRRRLGRAVLLS